MGLPSARETPAARDAPAGVVFVYTDPLPDGDPVFRDPPPAPEELAERFGSGMTCWVLQTYLRLRRAGHAVRLAREFVPGAVHVVHFDSLRVRPAPPDAFVVAVRGDRSPWVACELEIVQSPCNARPPRSLLLDHWPQPGILPRDPARGARVERIGYMGYGVNLAPAFRDAGFREGLRARGVELVERHQGEWHDYRDLDLVLAVRAIPRVFLRTKPASKLVNAWLGEAPALLGREPAYRHIGRPGEDFLEVEKPGDVYAALDRLRSEPAFYAALQERGRMRARGHDVASVQRQWLELLAGPVRLAHDAWSRERALRGPRRRVQRAREWLGHKLFWSTAHGERLLRGGKAFGG